jgi:hypothetical protein
VMYHLGFEFLGRWYFVDYFWLFLLVDFFLHVLSIFR